MPLYGYDPNELNGEINRARTKLPAGLKVDNSQLLLIAGQSDPLLQSAIWSPLIGYIGNPQGTIEGTRRVIDSQVGVPVGQMTAEAQRVAMSAERQLANDVRLLDAQNKAIDEWNNLVNGVLTVATGVSLKPEQDVWRKWYVDQLGFRYNLTTPDAIPTTVENVPLNDQARPVSLQYGQQSGFVIVRHSCFGKGTLVQTDSGPRAIETLQAGDQVLSQNTRTGKLGYQPIVMIHHNPPSATCQVKLGDKSVVTSLTHRFWKAGHGWVMARDLQVGDPIRTLGGVAKITAIENDKVQPVFNLDVAENADFFVGDLAILVHDNTLPDLKQPAFDASAALATSRP